jgi:hypothetical protein
MPMFVDQVEHRQPLSSVTIASPSITHDCTGSYRMASKICGKRLARSWPLRLVDGEALVVR